MGQRPEVDLWLINMRFSMFQSATRNRVVHFLDLHGDWNNKMHLHTSGGIWTTAKRAKWFGTFQSSLLHER